MYPTVGYIQSQFAGLLDDPLQRVFTNAVFQTCFNEAYDVLYSAFLLAQAPRIELMLEGIIVPPFTPSLTPVQMGIQDFGDFIFLRERPFGTDDKFVEMTPLDVLPQTPMSTMLRWFNWRNNTFYFVGATQSIELQLKYDTSGEAPTNTGTQVLVDSCANFLANYSAGVAGQLKGYDSMAARCMLRAVGPKYDMGTIGGMLFQLIQPLVRSRQHVQIAPKPYSSSRRVMVRRAIPYVAAQQGTTGGGAMNVPIQFSTMNGTIVPVPDGVSLTFYLTIGGVYRMEVYRNGVAQTFGVDYTSINNQMTFLSPPQLGDIITADAYIAPTGVQAPPLQPITNIPTMPIILSSANGQLTGAVDGINQTFSWSYPIPGAIFVFVNGAQKTVGIDYDQPAATTITLTVAPAPGSVVTIATFTV